MDILPRDLNKRRTQKAYKNVAWFYDIWSRLTEYKALNIALELANIRDGQDILEVACGTGNLFKRIVQLNPHGQNVAIDLSPHMLAKAHQKLQDKRQANYVLKEGNALQLDFENDRFDTVINNFMIDLMPEERLDAVAREFYRVTKPGGIAVITNFSFGTKRVNKIWYWIARYFPALLTGCRPVRFEDSLRKAGFVIEKNIQVSQNTFPSEVTRARKPGTVFS